MAMEKSQHPRLFLHNFLSQDVCKELEFIHKSCCTVGYRPNVFSTTLSHLIATNCTHLVMPFVPIRERLKETAEEFFGCEYELCIEFTGLISWCRGASIGWHSDDNRPYLKQRDFSAVCYLNNHGVDFSGGLFHFKDGEPTTITPVAGDVLMYTADSRNIHSVDEITSGERLTLTLWFSRDSSHDEDVKLVSLIFRNPLDNLYSQLGSYLPLPASSNMYWFPANQASEFESGFHICCARMLHLGFDICPSLDLRSFYEKDSSFLFSELLEKPLRFACRDEVLNKEFVNILHALQVVEYYHWKRSELQATTMDKKNHSVEVQPLSLEQREKVHLIRYLFLKDSHLAESVYSCMTHDQVLHFPFDWVSFSVAIEAWEAYTHKLLEELVLCLPSWKMQQSIFSDNFIGLQKEN